MIKPVAPADFQALQMLVIAITQHLSSTSPQFRPLLGAVSQRLASGEMALPGVQAELADHAVGEFQDAWEWLIKRALPPKSGLCPFPSVARPTLNDSYAGRRAGVSVGALWGCRVSMEC